MRLLSDQEQNGGCALSEQELDLVLMVTADTRVTGSCQTTKGPKSLVSTESPSMTRVRRVIAEATEPLDGRTIAHRACISFVTFSNCYRHLLLNAGLIHVSAWVSNPIRGPFVPLYSDGPLVGSAPRKPPKITSAERSREWKERTGYLSHQKALRRLARPRDKMLAALMGVMP